jgi:hypothetical protein
MKTQLDIIRAAQNVIARHVPEGEREHIAKWFRECEDELRAEPKAVAVPQDRFQQQPPHPKAVALAEQIDASLILPRGVHLTVRYDAEHRGSGVFHLDGIWTDGVERRGVSQLLSEHEIEQANDFGLIKSTIGWMTRTLFDVKDRT